VTDDGGGLRTQPGVSVEEFLDASPDALIVVSETGIIEFATAAAFDLFGYEPAELVGLPIERLLPVGMREDHVRHRAVYLESPTARPMGFGLDLRALRKGGGEFPVDISLVPDPRPGSRRVAAFVRDATRRKRDEDLLLFVNEISRITIEGWDTTRLLTMVAARARSLVGASTAWVAVRSPSDDRIEITAADGQGAPELVGATVPVSTSLSAKVMSDGHALLIDDMSAESLVISAARTMGLGPGVYLPMTAENGPIGALVLARLPDQRGFSDDEVRTAEVFATAAAVVFALGGARSDAEAGRLTSEQERIGRDLHDTVIQRLFALGMRLQATQPLAEGPIAERIRETVDAIDEVIREIRETIFHLGRRDADKPHVRNEIRGVAAEAVEHLGFAPRAAFRGPVESAITDTNLLELLAVLREGLANVGRHASATRVDVVVSVDGDGLTLTIADDGVGITDVPTAGNGTVNMAIRAERLGGSFSLTRRDPKGTLLRWNVPARSQEA
jgi:PAS domain S-box-containing protein